MAKKAYHYKIDGKYNTLDVVPIYDTSGYNIIIDGQTRYNGMIFTKEEVNEKIQFLSCSCILLFLNFIIL